MKHLAFLLLLIFFNQTNASEKTCDVIMTDDYSILSDVASDLFIPGVVLTALEAGNIEKAKEVVITEVEIIGSVLVEINNYCFDRLNDKQKLVLDVGLSRALALFDMFDMQENNDSSRSTFEELKKIIKPDENIRYQEKRAELEKFAKSLSL